MANKDINTAPTAAKADIAKTDQLLMSDGGTALKKAAISDIEKVINGETSLSGIGDGTVTGAISALNSKQVFTNVASVEFQSKNAVMTLKIISSSPSSNYPSLWLDFTSTGINAFKNIGNGWVALWTLTREA